MATLPTIDNPNSKEINRLHLLALLLLAILVYFPLIGTGFTTNDDLMISNGPAAGSWWSGLEAARSQGRIGFFLGVPLLKIPYFFDNTLYFNLVRLGSPLLLLATLFVLLRHVYKNSAVAALTVGYFLAFIQNGYEQNLLTSYPVAFNIQFTAFLAALLAFCFSIERKSKKWGVISALLYGITLANESFFLYGIVFFGIAFFYSLTGDEKLEPDAIFARTFRKLIPIITVGALYLSAYFVWRYIYPSFYDGNTVNLSEPKEIFRVLWVFSTSAFPGYKFFKHDWQYFPLVTSYAPAGYQFKTVIAEMRVEWVVKAILIACLTISVLSQKIIQRLPSKILIAVLIISFVCVFLPNMLVSLTAVYRAWLRAGSTSYHYTYYSFIAIVVFLGAFSVLILKTQAKKSRRYFSLVAIITISSIICSIGTDFHNYFVAKDQKLSQKKWTVVNEFLKTDAFAKIPPGATIYAPSLYVGRNIVAIHPGYWRDYIRRKTGKVLNVVEKVEEVAVANTTSVFFLKWLQDAEGINQVLIFSPLKDRKQLIDLNRVSSKNAVIFSYSRARSVTLIGHTIQGQSQGTVKIDGETVSESNGASFTKLVKFNEVSPFPSITLSGDMEFDLENLAFSYFGDNIQLSVVNVALGKSFYNWEKVGNQDRQSWSKGDATLVTTNLSSNPLNAIVSMRLTTLTPREVTITAGTSVNTVQLMPNKWTSVEMAVELQPGKSEITLSTNSLAQLPGGADQRRLSFLVSSLTARSALTNP